MPPRAAKSSRAERCQHCGTGLRHELLTFEARLLGSRWEICPACVGVLLEQHAAADEEALAILDDLWALPFKGPQG